MTDYEIGFTFYNWKIIGKSLKNGYYICECQCKHKTICEFRVDHIKNGTTKKKCNLCLEEEKGIIGKTFGKLTVIEKDSSSPPRHPYYLCKCSCNNPTLVRIRLDKLKSYVCPSCGCYTKGENWWKKDNEDDILYSSKVIHHYIGEKIGDWVIIERVKKPDWEKRTGSWWKLKCTICGEEKILKGIRITEQRVGKCSKIIGTKGEIKISKLLSEIENITYKKEYKFDDLIGENNIPLRFDFAIFENSKLKYLIEYNGIQHYKEVEYFGGEEGYKKRLYRDNKKKEYCRNNKIPLIIIPYTHYDNILKEDIILETSKFVQE